MKPLEGKTALVTGGSRGIGRAISRRLAADGAFVLINYASNDDAAKETLAAIGQDGGRAALCRADIASTAGVRGLVADCADLLRTQVGTEYLDILVNNAGLLSERLVGTFTEDEYDRLMNVNVKGPFFLCQELLGLIPDGGRIINISSNGAHRAYPLAVSYCTSKHAMTGFTKTLASALGPRRINVNAVEPGFVPSDMFTELVAGRAQIAGTPGDVDRIREQTAAQVCAMTALGRLGEAEEVADAVAFFASHDSRWITGQCLAVDGGLLL